MEPVGSTVPVTELLRRSRWPVLRRLGLHPGGDERSRLRGTGIEYTDVREYQAGDDPRTIEWTITARSDRVYVRESTPDRGIDAWLVIDVTRSLDWGTARCLKRQLVLSLSTLVGQLLMGRGNRVGAVLFDDGIRSISAPAAGRHALLRLLSRIERTQVEPRTALDVRRDVPSSLAQALTHLRRAISRPSLLLVASDFLAQAGWQRPLQLLGMKHEVVAAWISDPRERAIPDVGVVAFEDPETGRQLVVDTRDARLRQRFEAAARVQADAIRADLRRARVAVAELTTAQEPFAQLLDFMMRRGLERSRPPAPATA